MKRLITVVVFGTDHIEIKCNDSYYKSEAKEFYCRCYLSDENLNEILIKDNPEVILSVGNI